MATETQRIITDKTGEKIVEALDTIANAVQNSAGGAGGYASLEDMTWSEIADICKAGKARGIFHIGQIKKATINGEEVFMRIVAFDHDDLATADDSYNGGYGKAAITWEMEDCFKGWYIMNQSATNVGGWKDCYMRNTTLANMYNNLDSDLKSAIKTVIKKTGQGNQLDALDETSDMLWLPCLEEIFGTDSPYFSSSSWQQRAAKGEGHQFEYYMGDNDTSFNEVNGTLTTRLGYRTTRYYNYFVNLKAIKAVGTKTTSYDYHWLRSPYLAGTNDFCTVYDGCGGYSGDDADGSGALAVCFDT